MKEVKTPAGKVRTRSPRRAVQPDAEAQAQFRRIMSVTGCRTQMQLSVFLGVRQTTVSDAKRKNRIPASWLVALYRSGINPDWVLTGQGERFLGQPEGDTATRDIAAEVTVYRNTLEAVLGAFPTLMLSEELARRTAFGG